MMVFPFGPARRELGGLRFLPFVFPRFGASLLCHFLLSLLLRGACDCPFHRVCSLRCICRNVLLGAIDPMTVLSADPLRGEPRNRAPWVQRPAFDPGTILPNGDLLHVHELRLEELCD
jgi:hypothetical protein